MGKALRCAGEAMITRITSWFEETFNDPYGVKRAGRKEREQAEEESRQFYEELRKNERKMEELGRKAKKTTKQWERLLKEEQRDAEFEARHDAFLENYKQIEGSWGQEDGVSAFVGLFALISIGAIFVVLNLILHEGFGLHQFDALLWAGVVTGLMLIVELTLPSPWDRRKSLWSWLWFSLASTPFVWASNIELQWAKIGMALLVGMSLSMIWELIVSVLRALKEWGHTGKITTRQQAIAISEARAQAQFETFFDDIDDEPEETFAGDTAGDDFGFDDSAFNGSSQPKEEPPRGYENRHPDDAKLWAIVDDPDANENERSNAFAMILKKQAKRNGKPGTDLV